MNIHEDFKFLTNTYKDDDKIVKELCVVCGCKTNIPVSKNIDERFTYEHGVGQLCIDCWKIKNCNG